MGFPAADFDECGPVVFGHGADAAAVRKAVQHVRRRSGASCAATGRWSCSARPTPCSARWRWPNARPSRWSSPTRRTTPAPAPTANTTGMLHALRAAGAGQRYPGRVALGLLFDPAAARAAHAAGVGATLPLALGKAVRTFDGSLSDAPVRRPLQGAGAERRRGAAARADDGRQHRAPGPERLPRDRRHPCQRRQRPVPDARPGPVPLPRRRARAR